MLVIFSEKLPRILKNKATLEKKLHVKITNRGKEVTIEGSAPDEYIAQQVIDAINFGFPFSQALSIKEEEHLFEILNIKDFAKSANLERVRGRIIGREGKTLATLSQLSECFLELKDNEVGIIGPPEMMKVAQEGVINLVRGAKQANVYAYLDKHRPLPVGSLELKEEKNEETLS